jgi:hypothetical protein
MVLRWFSGILEMPECLLSIPVAGTVIWELLSAVSALRSL